MEINLESSTAAVRDAASVVMLRDGEDGLEVFLMERHGLSDVLAGAYVFPGGKVDLTDHDDAWDAWLEGEPEALHAALGEPQIEVSRARALYIAAMREAFEEAGVLYARGAGHAQAQQARALLREGRSFDEVLALMHLRLSPALLQPWSRWITPVIGGVMRKRFDTRFFLAMVPAGQSPEHDNHEATDSRWLTPRAAIGLYRDRQIELAPPQIMGLAHLSRHDDVAGVFAQAAQRPPPLIHPEGFEEDGARLVCYPGDPRHSVRERALPGPTRLRFHAGRFEPLDGFDALFTDRA